MLQASLDPEISAEYDAKCLKLRDRVSEEACFQRQLQGFSNSTSRAIQVINSYLNTIKGIYLSSITELLQTIKSQTRQSKSYD